MNQFNEVLDEIQIPINAFNADPPTARPSNMTIISKFRNSFLPVSKLTPSPSKLLFDVRSLSCKQQKNHNI